MISRCLPIAVNFPDKSEQYIPDNFLFGEMPDYVPMSRLSSNIGESMRMMADIQRIKKTLPGIDCGACGAPSCRAHAEDMVRQGIQEISCPILIARGETGK